MSFANPHTAARKKAAIRKRMKERLAEVGEDQRQAASQAICQRLTELPEYAGASDVAIFDPLRSEPDVGILWQLAPRRFFYPRMLEQGLELLPVGNMADLVPVRGFAFREPADSQIPGKEILQIPSLILVPGIAFTVKGARLGRGGGFYDQLLSRLPAQVTRIGVCFDCQVVQELPTEPHDCPVQVLVTESRTVRTY